MAAHKRPYKSLLFTLWLLLLIGLGWWQRLNIHDWWRLYNYQPAPAIAALADNTTMKQPAKRLFYVYHPSLENSSNFNQHCSNTGEHTIILGCYSGAGIYLYDVTDERLSGIEEVTAVHEMLHAAYDRLSSDEKRQVNAMLERAYAGLNDVRIRSTVDNYMAAGADVKNELHSILGTEVRQLPADLEEYYGRYFENRLKVVEYSEKYETEFTSRKNRIENSEKRLAELKRQIGANEADLVARKAALDAMAAEMDQLRQNGQTEAYNERVPVFNARVNAYNAKIEETRDLIAEYNSLLEEVKALLSEQQTLYEAIDSKSVPQTL